MKTYSFPTTIKALYCLQKSGILIRYVVLGSTRSNDLVAFPSHCNCESLIMVPFQLGIFSFYVFPNSFVWFPVFLTLLSFLLVAATRK